VPLQNLSAEQQDAFHKRLKEFQMNPSQVVPRISSNTHSGPIVLSADPASSTIPPHILTLASVDEVKRLAGNADEEFESGRLQSHHEPLPEWPQHLNDSATSQLTPQQNQLVHKAHIAYVYGNSKNVASYKPIIEKLNYPLKVATFAVEDMCVDASNSPVIISSRIGVDIGTLTIYPGGQIKFESDIAITIQKMVKMDSGSCPKET